MKKRTQQFLVLIFFTLLLIAGLFIYLRSFSFEKTSLIIGQKNRVSVAIVPHHDLAQDQRRILLEKVSLQNQFQKIFVISTNHFLAGKGNVLTTDRTWRLQNSIIEPEKNTIDKIVESGLAQNEEAPFLREHGIFNVLPDLATNFPDAKIIPLILKPSLTLEESDQLAEALYKIDSNALVLASVDFSHYQPGGLAEIHDAFSISALSNLDEEIIFQAETDSPQTLSLAAHWAKLSHMKKFVLSDESNSGKLSNQPDAESTSYVTATYEDGEISPIKSSTFMFGGDAMFDRMVSYKFPEKKLKDTLANLGDRFFEGVNLSLLNLEGPIARTYQRPNISPNNMTFHFPPEVANVLKTYHFNAVSLANNHTLNGGQEELDNTRQVLRERNILTIGDSQNAGLEFPKDDLGVITINVFETGTYLKDKIFQAKEKGAFVIIMPHWGNEYQKNTHAKSQEIVAHQWIDQGADLVIGSHPHVIQDAEIYNGKPIFYSLGNFIFDQTFSLETQRGLVIAGSISESKLKLVILPTIIKNYQVELLTGDEKRETINKIKAALKLPTSSSDYGYDTIALDI